VHDHCGRAGGMVDERALQAIVSVKIIKMYYNDAPSQTLTTARAELGPCALQLLVHQQGWSPEEC
jgi:hypothetical protein